VIFLIGKHKRRKIQNIFLQNTKCLDYQKLRII
jgi:hypothetical protein